jgi:hypothetical protein
MPSSASLCFTSALSLLLLCSGAPTSHAFCTAPTAGNSAVIRPTVGGAVTLPLPPASSSARMTTTTKKTTTTRLCSYDEQYAKYFRPPPPPEEPDDDDDAGSKEKPATTATTAPVGGGSGGPFTFSYLQQLEGAGAPPVDQPPPPEATVTEPAPPSSYHPVSSMSYLESLGREGSGNDAPPPPPVVVEAATATPAVAADEDPRAAAATSMIMDGAAASQHFKESDPSILATGTVIGMTTAPDVGMASSSSFSSPPPPPPKVGGGGRDGVVGVGPKKKMASLGVDSSPTLSISSPTISITIPLALQPPKLGKAKNIEYGERSRTYRRTVYGHDDWVRHRSPDRFVRNLASITNSGIYKVRACVLCGAEVRCGAVLCCCCCCTVRTRRDETRES